MPKKENPVGVTPKPGYHNYVDANLKIVEGDIDNYMSDSYDCEETFRANADIDEGVSGLKAIDTTYENTSESIIENPKSDRKGLGGGASVQHPAARPADLHRYPHRRY